MCILKKKIHRCENFCMMTGISYKTEFGSFPPQKKCSQWFCFVCIYLMRVFLKKKKKKRKIELPDFWCWRNKKRHFQNFESQKGHRISKIPGSLFTNLWLSCEEIFMVRKLLFFLLLFFFFNYALVCKKSATELHEEGNIVYIEYYMRLVHNSDEKKSLWNS